MSDMIPFGKYRGKPVEAMSQDHEYVQWLIGQDWFRSKYPSMFNVVINNFAEPCDTPAHNKIQAMFLDESTCKSLVELTIKTKRGPSDGGKNWRVDSVSDIKFETSGIDVIFLATFWTLKPVCRYEKDPEHYGFHMPVQTGEMRLMEDEVRFAIEVKPSIGDDYPTVLRQILRTHRSHAHLENILVYEDFQASGITESQLHQIFATQGIFCARLGNFTF